MRANFRAWAIEVDESPPAEWPALVARLLDFAVLAPSSHNTQPWQFAVGDGFVDVMPDFRRGLPATDVDNRQLYVSLGCAIGFLVLAADAHDIDSAVRYLDGDAPGARVTLSGAGQAELADRRLLERMRARSTNRLPYLDRRLPARLREAVRGLGGDGIEIHLTEGADSRRRVGDIVVDGVEQARGDRAFFRELADYLLPNLSRRPVGMTGDTMGWSLPASLLIPLAMRYLQAPPMSEAERQKYRDHTEAYAIICSSGDDPRSWMDAGRSYARLALLCEAFGVSSNNLAGPVTARPLRTRLAALVDTRGLPQLCVRLGYAPRPMPHSPRLTAARVTTAAGSAQA